MTGFDTVALRGPAPQLVTVFGGSGFVGRHIVRALAMRGYRIRVAVRRPDLAQFLQPLGRVGQIAAVQANLRYPASVTRAVERSDIVINAVGILQETGRQSFEGIQTEGAGDIARAAAAIGVPLVHLSALGADAGSQSLYARSKALGEEAVLAAVPEAVVLRPSVVFGPGDSFFNRFAAIGRVVPVIPLAGAETRFQPVFVGDVAEAVALAVEGKVAGGRIYELGGPEVKTLRELVALTLKVTGRGRPIVPLPWPVARAQGLVMEIADRLTLGLMPAEIKLTRDQVLLLQSDNVVTDAARREGRTLEGLGIAPQAVEALLPSYLWRFRKAGQFSSGRTGAAGAAIPGTIAAEGDPVPSPVPLPGAAPTMPRR